MVVGVKAMVSKKEKLTSDAQLNGIMRSIKEGVTGLTIADIFGCFLLLFVACGVERKLQNDPI